MPIKLPKGILSRKASGNALEELRNPPEPSFRVIERPQNSRSFDGGESLKRMSHGRTLSADRFTEEHLLTTSSPNPNNRGSGGTNNSRSSGGNDNSSASARFSSTSTLPSSTDMPLDDRSSPNPKDRFDMPVAPPVPESTSGRSLRAAGRAFSFGRKKADPSQTPPRPSVEHIDSEGPAHHTRDRALTESSYASGSTATPPKLLDAGFDIASSDDTFGSMFENFGKRRSQIAPLDQEMLGALRTQSPERMSPGAPRPSDRSTSSMTPAPLNIDRNQDTEPSTSSWASQNSKDGRVASSSPMERTFSYEDDTAFNRAGNGPPRSRTMPMNNPPSPPQRTTQKRTPSGGLVRSSAYGVKRGSTGDQLDADARLVMDSISASRKLERYSSENYSDEDENPAAPLVSQSSSQSSPYAAQGPFRMPENRQRSPGPVFDSSDRDFTSNGHRQGSAETTPRAQKSHLAYQDDISLFDAPSHSGRQAPVIGPKIAPPARPQTQNKIMTPAQFEQYRRQQEMTSTAHPRDKQESDDEDDYEDDDEIERSKQAARQRRKQEAHMSVYRQQMMKMTGEQPSDLPNIQLRPGIDRSSMSAPTLGPTSTIPEFSFDKPSESGKASDEEDEDVPLGVLAAHGFPSKNRPPTAMSNAGSRVQFKSESYPPPPASVNGGPAANRASTLPAFARNLPPDPYFGAGLVNAPNRESLAFGQGVPRSVQGGSQMGSASPVPGPPGGLVGVINAEERARAARRGSPNGGGMPLPSSMGGMPPMMTPGEQATQQATTQMSEQMNQMMQMQMQWMKQMQAMMTGGGMMMPPQPPPGQQPPFMPPMPQMMMPPGMAPPPLPPGQSQQRPLSQGSHSAPITPMGQPPQQRAMSMINPGPGALWPPNMPSRKSMAPSMMSGALDSLSIAPSERSNVGQPSRYRPVSIAPADENRAGSRASTFTEGTLQPGVSARNSRLSTSGDRTQSRLSGLRAMSASPQPLKKAASDDDEEEGWAAMKQKTDKKKSMWRLNRKSKALDKAEQADFEIYDLPVE